MVLGESLSRLRMATTLKTGMFSNVHTVLTVLIAAKRLTSGQLGVAWAVHDGSGTGRGFLCIMDDRHLRLAAC